MKLDPEDQRTSFSRRWGLPLGVAAGVAALSVGAVTALGGHHSAKPVALTAQPMGAGVPASASPSMSPSSSRSVSASASAGAGAGGAFTVTSTATTPIDARSVGRILASCLGAGASRYHAVIAVRTPIASQEADGVVVAVDSAGQYVQCQAKGDKGNSPDVPPTFINNRMWNADHTIEFFDSFGEPAKGSQYLMVGAGHYTSGIAKVTVSYGDDPKQYPTIMAGGAFFYAAAVTVDTPPSARVPQTPDPLLHAFDASGKEVYHQ